MNTTRIIIVAVGGQGNLLASKVLGEAAILSGVPVRMSEIHGMAQRGGVVESAILLGDGESTIISDGEADIFISFEPSEALRALKKCSKDTIIISNLSPLPPFTVAIGKGKYPEMENVKNLLEKNSSRFISLDAVSLAEKAGNVMSVNMVLLGALAQTGALPLSSESIKEAIKTKTKQAFVDTNLKAFDLGFAEAEK